MSELEIKPESDLEFKINDACKQLFSHLPFLRLFNGFRMAIQWEKMFLGVVAIILVFLIGGILQNFAPKAAVTTANTRGYTSSGQAPDQTEIDLYVTDIRNRQAQQFTLRRDALQQTNKNLLLQALRDEPFNLTSDKADKIISNGTALDVISEKYDQNIGNAIDILQRYYDRGYNDLQSEYKAALEISGHSEDQNITLKTSLQHLKQVYTDLFNAVCGDKTPDSTTVSVNELVKTSNRLPEKNRPADRKRVQKDRVKILETIQTANAMNIARAYNGKGIFSAFVDYKLQHLHNAISSLVLHGNFSRAGSEFYKTLVAGCWLSRFHPVFSFILLLAMLAIWAIFGGAICRISALQIARQERISPKDALHFSLSRFSSFFAAPLAPMVIILVVMLAIWLPGLLTAIPVIGEIIAGLLFPLTLIGGFVMALVIIGLIGGFNLMFPAVAVEGSDSFDAISRSFSYIFARPWRMGFYTLVSAVYGSICYLFVRFFVFLILFMVHISAGGAMNLDGSSYLSIRGKLDAMWQTPTFSHLYTPLSSINWSGLNFSESFGAFFIWIWVAIAAASLMAFVVSYFFSINTTIYLLLRQKVDATDIEDIYIDHDVEGLLSEETDAEVVVEAETTTEEKTNATPETEPDAHPAEPADTNDTPDMADTDNTDDSNDNSDTPNGDNTDSKEKPTD